MSSAKPLVHLIRGDVPFDPTPPSSRSPEDAALSQLDADSLRVSVIVRSELAEALRAANPVVIPATPQEAPLDTVIVDRSLPDEEIRDMVEE